MTEKKECLCPYCDTPLPICEEIVCEKCKIELVHCKNCNGMMRKDAEICPHCGGRA